MRKLFGILCLSALCAALLFGAAPAASKKPMSRSPQAGMAAMYGTWKCYIGKSSHTHLFSPLWGGKGMSITENGKPAGLDLVTFDSKRGVYIDEFMDSAGDYAVMEGKPSGKKLMFTQVYPAGVDGRLTIVQTSPKFYYDDFSITLSGKMQKEHEDCTKQ